jgi:hypothetical protein
MTIRDNLCANLTGFNGYNSTPTNFATALMSAAHFTSNEQVFHYSFGFARLCVLTDASLLIQGTEGSLNTSKLCPQISLLASGKIH